MKLAIRELPLVRFREALPAWLQPLGAAYIEIDARPAGRVNQSFMAGQNALIQAKASRDRKLGIPFGTQYLNLGELIAQCPDVDIGAKRESDGIFNRDFAGLVYDACIIEWRTNMLNGETGEPLTADRETLLDLIEVPFVELETMWLRFQTAALQAGADVLEQDAATIKN